MPIIEMEKWSTWVKNNQDPYGKFCVDVAREAMKMIDDDHFQLNDASDGYKLICKASKKLGGGLTGFQAGAVCSMIQTVHSTGEFFTKHRKEIV